MANLLIVGSLLLGLGARAVLPGMAPLATSTAGPVVDVLLLFIGLQIGTDLGWLKNIRRLALETAFISGSAVVGSLGAAMLWSMVDPILSLRQAAMVASGLGFYSLTSIILNHAGLETLAVLGFLVNFLREILSLLAAPLIARFFGALAPIAATASASDSGAPVITRICGAQYGAVCISSAFVLSVCVPVLLRFLLPAH